MKTGAKKKPMLMAAIKEEQQQAQLREAYGITEKVKVVEKKTRTAQMLRVLINAAFVVVRCAALLAIAGLAIIGLATLIYPNMRAAALETWQEIVLQLADFLCK